MCSNPNISKRVLAAIEDEGIENPVIEITSQTEQGDNFLGVVSFAIVTGSNNKSLDVVIKSGKSNEKLREQINLPEFYRREIIVYTKVFPVFREFELKKGLKHRFDLYPKCYNAVMEEEIVVLDNLKSLGFHLHPRSLPMNVEHIYIILKAYARLHAISFAMRDQNLEQFNYVSDNMKPIVSNVLIAGSFNNYFEQMFERNMTVLQELEPELHKKLTQIFASGFIEAVLEADNPEIDDVVITHGDCWNNNFMFKYEVRNWFTVIFLFFNFFIFT